MAEESENSEEKTEQATPYRREEFRRMGQVAQSREIGSVLVLFSVAITGYFVGRMAVSEIAELFSRSFTDSVLAAARQGDLFVAFKQCLAQGLKVVIPVLGVAMLMGIASTVAQIGFMVTWDRVTLNIDHINPLSGFKRIFALRSLIEGAKSVLKIAIVVAVGYFLIRKEMGLIPQLVNYSVSQTLAYTGFILFKLITGICVFMAVVAALDYAYQWWDIEKRMRMSKQEVKEEFKQREGDPLIKARIKRIQRELVQKRMMEDVKKADVIVTNPTHLAVAIQYDRLNMAAPVVVAKGADFIAEKIKEVAKKHGVPVIENKPLARSLYKTIKIGQSIPRSLYQAVAEVLAYVYKMKGRAQAVAQQINQSINGDLNG